MKQEMERVDICAGLRRFVVCLTLMVAVLTANGARPIVAVMEQPAPFGSQSTVVLPEGKCLSDGTVSDFWLRNMMVTAVTFACDRWIASASTKTGLTQGISDSREWPDTEVHRQMQSGYMITSLASSPDRWIIMTSQGSGYLSQQIASGPTPMATRFVDSWLGRGLWITSVAARENLWTVVMSETEDILEQRYFLHESIDRVLVEMDRNARDGFMLSSLARIDDGLYMAVFTKRAATGPAPVQNVIIADDVDTFLERLERLTEKGYMVRLFCS